jgi:hypothetical protein
MFKFYLSIHAERGIDGGRSLESFLSALYFSDNEPE